MAAKRARSDPGNAAPAREFPAEMPWVARSGVSRLSRRVFRRLAIPLVLVAAILLATAGLLRLRFDTDILSMMPGDLPEVKGLKAFHDAFSRNDELIVVIEGGGRRRFVRCGRGIAGQTAGGEKTREARALAAAVERESAGHRGIVSLPVAQWGSGNNEGSNRTALPCPFGGGVEGIPLEGGHIDGGSGHGDERA